MKIKIKYSTPVLHKQSNIDYSVEKWSVTGTYLKDGYSCDCQERPFDIYINHSGLTITDKELVEKVEQKLLSDGV